MRIEYLGLYYNDGKRLRIRLKPFLHERIFFDKFHVSNQLDKLDGIIYTVNTAMYQFTYYMLWLI